MLIKFKNNQPKGVTKKGLESGIQPEVTEMLQKAIDETTSPIIQPLSETEKQTKVEDSGMYKGVYYEILRSSENHFRAFARTKLRGRTIEFTTLPYKQAKYAWIEIKSRIDLFANISPKLDNRWKADDFAKQIMN